MVMVCKEWFPIGSYPNQTHDGFYMEELLKLQLDYLIKNVPYDWAFTGIISGNGEVRVGKSVLAMQIACYWVYEVNRLYGKQYDLTVPDNFVFNGNELIAKGNKLGTEQVFSCIVYDEAGADIQGVKVMSGATQEVLDYLRECGQYNMLTLLVLPDFFSLPRGIAMTYSTFLIDVNYEADEQGYFERGHYRFFSRRQKKKLFMDGKRELDYHAAKPDFRGSFNNVFTVDEVAYRQAKKDALKKREKEKPMSRMERRHMAQKNIAWLYLSEQVGLTYQQIADIYRGIDKIQIEDSVVGDGINAAKKLLGRVEEF